MKSRNNNIIYLVTGAAGFLGSEICRQLLEEKKKVRALVLPKDPAIKFVPKQIEVVKGDLCDITSLDKFFDIPEGFESIVIHCASMIAIGIEYNQKVMDVNVTGTENIINQCLGHKECKKMVYVGSTGAIPELPNGQKMREITEFDEKKVYGLYGQSKAIACQRVLDAVKNQNLNACIVHPSGILGPGDFAKGETTSGMIQMLQGSVHISLAGTFNLCDVRDLARGILNAVEKGRVGETYILGNKVVTNKEFTNMVAKAGKCKCAKIFLPGWIANIIAGFMESKAKKKGERAFLTKYLVYNLTRNNEFDSQKARKELGYTTRPFEETIEDEVRWLQQNAMV